jgi:predicted alpha/beta-fold hydrolase
LLTKNQKRLILSYFDVLFSFFIWNINQNIFGNPFFICLILSVTTFLIVFTPFEIYWSFQDFWFERWKKIDTDDLIISRINIAISNSIKGKPKYLSALLISPKDKSLLKSKNTIVIICHGFSDSKESLQFFYLPLVLQGYLILTYDARGTKGSKKAGKKHQFLERIEDYKRIIDWIRNDDQLKSKQIFSVGFSIGAMTVICGGFSNETVSKIIAISSLSYYKKNLRSFNPIVLLNYILKGVKLFPNEDDNRRLSPYLIMKEFKKSNSEEIWLNSSKKVLLIHARNDRVIKFFNFDQNKELLALPNHNTLILKKGGHTQKKNEMALVGKTLRFFSS